MIDIEDFLPQINPKAPGVPLPTARQAILQAAMQICERSRLWKHSVELVVNDLDDIAFTPPEGAVLLDYESILFRATPDGCDIDLEAKTSDWMDRCMRGWRRGSIPGYPKYFSQTSIGTLRIAPIENGFVTINMTLKPTIDADQLPDFLMQQYGEMVAWGALGRILSTPDQPFTDFAAGAAYLQAFEQKLASLSFKASSGQQRARVRTKANYM